MADKEQRFGLVMNDEERKALDNLARQERISQAAVLRRLIWKAYEETLSSDKQQSSAS